MEERFQNIIVGAGIAGLICGGYLSKYGQKTLILEKGKDLGGRLEVHKFSGYTGVAQLPTWMSTWNGGFWPQAARELGANIKFFVNKEPKIYIKGSHEPAKNLPRCFTAPAMLDFAQSQLQEPFSAEVKEEFLKIFQELLTVPYKRLSLELDRVRLKDWVEARSSSPIVQRFFTALTANMLLMEAEMAWEVASAGGMFSILRNWLTGDGTWVTIYPDLMNGMIKPFADVMNSFGGEIRTRHKVTEIIVEKGRAVGVTVRRRGQSEKKIYSDRVIVTCPYNFIPKLFKKLPPELEEPIQELEKTSLLDYYIFSGLRERVTEDPSVVLVMDPDTGSHLGGIYAQSIEQPWSVPPGKHLIWMYKVFTPEDAERLRTKDIFAEMNDIQEELYPGFKKAVEVQHYAGHTQALWHHPLSAFPKIPQKSSTVEELYFSGDSTIPQHGPGVDGAASRGISCAKRILGVEKMNVNPSAEPSLQPLSPMQLSH